MTNVSDTASDQLNETQNVAQNTAPIEDDEWADFRTLSEEDKKWALLQLQLDREQKYFDSISLTD